MVSYNVALFGHRYIENPKMVEDRLEKQLRRILKEDPSTDFIVGRNGEFDCLAAATIRRVRKSIEDVGCRIMLLLPYYTAEYMQNQEAYENYYDLIGVCGHSERVHPKSAIGVRNREMVDEANLVICYVERRRGGAYAAMQYAMHSGKTVINLAEDSEE